MTTLITLVIPIGGDSGPFNLSSNVNGYTPPFETNISASTLTAGYTTALVPDGTTTIRVTSVGVCTNYIDIPVGLTPTTTTTSSSSSTSTSTTTAAPITTTTTSSSTSTSTSTSTTTVAPTTTTTTTSELMTTTTTTTKEPLGACTEYFAVPGEGGGTVTYTLCDGSDTLTVPVSADYPFCAAFGTVTQSNCTVGIIGPCTP